jgi:AcrR family transcriptional regulator
VSAAEQRRGPGRTPEGVREAIIETTLELIADIGVSRLTTKEIARVGGFSEASIYYHFADKAALLEGAILDGVLAPFQQFAAGFAERAPDGDIEPMLLEFTRELTAFWEQILPLLSAVQSDAALRKSFQRRVNALDLGPHRGVRLVARLLARQQELGAIRADVEPEPAAMLICSTCYLTGYQRHMLGPKARRQLPGLAPTVAALVAMLRPPRSGQ